MIIAIHQPQYLPWIGYFDKMQKADAFCYLDNVQYKKNEWQNRNRIKTAKGWQWITVPVLYRFPQKINDLKINNTVNWRHKHIQAISTNYGKAPYFKEYFRIFEQSFEMDWLSLSSLNIYLIEQIRNLLELNHKPTTVASELKLSENPTDRLIDICKALGGNTYLSGPDGAKYLDLEKFRIRGIKVIFQDFIHPDYPQLFGEYQSHMSVMDLLFNCGPESLNKLR